MDFDPLLAREGGVGELDEVGVLLGEDVGDGALWVLGAGAFGSAGRAPLVGLVVELVEVAESPGAEEALANEPDEPFYPTLLISPRGCDGARLEAVVGDELEQRGMEPDGVGAAFEYDAAHVVVEHGPGRASECAERLDVAADEVGERGAEGEAQERMPRVAQHWAQLRTWPPGRFCPRLRRSPRPLRSHPNATAASSHRRTATALRLGSIGSGGKHVRGGIAGTIQGDVPFAVELREVASS